jgi:hypothetical protein
MDKNAPFKFTREQRNSLIDSWKRKADRLIAAKIGKGYIDTVERIVHFTLIAPPDPPEDKTPQQERDDDESMLDLSRRLRGALVRKSARSTQAINERMAGHTGRSARDWYPVLLCADDRLARLVESLVSLEGALESRLERPTPSTMRKGVEIRERLMLCLVDSYQQSFSKKPSASPTGNFRNFLDTLSDILLHRAIIKIPLGGDLLKRVIADLKI